MKQKSIKNKKIYKYISILVLLALLATSIPLTIAGFSQGSTLNMDNASAEDKRIASEISNETGVTIDEVFKLKTNQRTWNDVLRMIKNSNSKNQTGLKDERDKLLLDSGLTEDVVKDLKADGFTDDNINEVKMLVDRVVMQLSDIVQENSTKIEAPKVDITVDNDKSEDISSYEKLSKQIDVKKAIYFALKLSKDYGSYELALDEYLYSLQLDLDLNDYLKDKEAYLKKRDEKKANLSEQDKLTVSKIEEKALQVLQADEDKNKEADATVNIKPDTNNSSTDMKDTDLPELPQANPKDNKPQNPTDDVMNEIKSINPIDK